MIKILNPFQKTYGDDYQCFGCSKNNPIGLQLDFFREEETIITFFEPKKCYEGYLEILHGGIQATLHDEIASWVVYAICGTAGVTSSMNIKYRKPVSTNNKIIQLKANMISQTSRIVIIKTQLLDQEDKVCSEGEIAYFLFPVEIAMKQYNYPGKEAFYEANL